LSLASRLTDLLEVKRVENNMITFGPVPSRRLGRSLGVNNIPPKTCTYACAYCQLGRTIKMQVKRQAFYAPELIIQSVAEKVRDVLKCGDRIDYLTLVPDGEPTLDANLGCVIDGLRPLGIKIAVISNGSLIWREDVRQDLSRADWVSLKVDSTRAEIWHCVDRPHGWLHLPDVLDGVRSFAADYAGELVTETMLCGGVNDEPAQLEEVAAFLAEVSPVRSYITAPVRPPAEAWVHLPTEAALNQAYQILASRVRHVELLAGYEGNEFACTGDAARDILSITSVHPMREDAVTQLLERSSADWAVVRDLLGTGQLVESAYEGHRFYVRCLQRRQ